MGDWITHYPIGYLPLKLRHWSRFGPDAPAHEMQARIRKMVSEQNDSAKNQQELKRNLVEMLVTYECLFEEGMQDCDELKKRIAVISRSAQRGNRISEACLFLEVARSTYYHAQHKTDAAQADEYKAGLIRQVHENSFFTLGRRRIGETLAATTGLRLSECLLARLMRQFDLRARIRQPRRPSSEN